MFWWLFFFYLAAISFIGITTKRVQMNKSKFLSQPLKTKTVPTSINKSRTKVIIDTILSIQGGGHHRHRSLIYCAELLLIGTINHQATGHRSVVMWCARPGSVGHQQQQQLAQKLWFSRKNLSLDRHGRPSKIVSFSPNFDKINGQNMMRFSSNIAIYTKFVSS